MEAEFKAKIAALKKHAALFTVLYVEDEQRLREEMATLFKKIFTHVDTAADGPDALDHYMRNDYDIVITDIQMPKMNGIELIEQIRRLDRHQEVIVISAYRDSEYLTRSIELDVSGYILKPTDLAQLIKTLERSIYKLMAFRENEMYKQDLESMVEERTRKVLELQNEQVDNYHHAIYSLVKMVEARDAYTGGHSERVAKYSQDIARALGMPSEACDLIYEAGILHDIGKIITPDAILLKPGRLTQEEYSLIKDHVTASHEILNEIPMYVELADIVFAHHEHLDGSGYPRGLKGDEISIYAKIMMVADAFDAMTTNRIYKPKKRIDEALEELQRLSGIWYDADVIAHAVKIFRDVDIDVHAAQSPRSLIDDERFAYFYKDPLTHVYNQNYLDFILQRYRDRSAPVYLHVLYLQKFTSYNQQYGWDEGDRFLSAFSAYLRSEFPDAQTFRIFGDDFVLIQDQGSTIDIDVINSMNLFKTSDLYCKYKRYDLQRHKIESYKALQE